MTGLRRCRLVLPLLLLAPPVHALVDEMINDGEWKAELAAEYWFFDNPGNVGQSRSDLSLRFQPNYYFEAQNAPETFTFEPFVRLDQQDGERTHVDIREALWTHLRDDFEARAGISRVTWGKTEFGSVVDVINQRDLVEGNRDEKLGQPMAMMAFEREWGYLDVYVLPFFRERTFPGRDGRLRSPFVVDTDRAAYEQGSELRNLDVAARWHNQVTDEIEMGVSGFIGMERDPLLLFNFDLLDPAFIPYYYRKQQLGLELEYINEGWVGKLEYAMVRNSIENYSTAVTGGEYTFGAFMDSDMDLTLIAEYLWDGRGDVSQTFFEHDIGFGTRLTFNDVESTELLAAVIVDTQSREQILTFEASRRIGDDWRLKLTGMRVAGRSPPPAAGSNLSLIADLQQSGVFDSSLSFAELGRILGVAAEDSSSLFALANAINGNDDILDYEDPRYTPALQQLVAVSDTGNKLAALESDNYLQLELTWFY
jgi:hypothetical protein